MFWDILLVWIALRAFVCDSRLYKRYWMKSRGGYWPRLKAKRWGAAASRRYRGLREYPVRSYGRECGNWIRHPRIPLAASGDRAEGARVSRRKIRHWWRILRNWSNPLRVAIPSRGCAGPAKAYVSWPKNWSAWAMK